METLHPKEVQAMNTAAFEAELLADHRKAFAHLTHLQTTYRPIMRRTKAQDDEIGRAWNICTVANMRAGR